VGELKQRLGRAQKSVSPMQGWLTFFPQTPGECEKTRPEIGKRRETKWEKARTQVTKKGRRPAATGQVGEQSKNKEERAQTKKPHEKNYNHWGGEGPRRAGERGGSSLRMPRHYRDNKTGGKKKKVFIGRKCKTVTQ